MSKNRTPKKQGSPAVTALLVLTLLFMMALTGLMIYLCTTVVKRDPAPDRPAASQQEQKPQSQQAQPAETKAPETVPTETTLPPVPQLVSTAKVTVTGDLLPHITVYGTDSVIRKSAQEYDFSSVFKFLNGYTDTADYAVANLETSLGGKSKPYSGNPKFNTPDAIVDGAKAAGFDMLLTANNHCNDTGIDGVLRTVEVIREKGLTALGTNLNEEEKKYHIQDVGGMKIGMLCYTYEDSQQKDLVTLNYNPLPKKSSGLVCTFPKFFSAKSRDPFYENLTAQIAEMRENGAEFIVLFVHWGEEYHLEASADQKKMAQRFCDLGVDLIIGGHPHVVEPVELLTSTQDPDHKTVCLYSLGNAVSNQRRDKMSSMPTGHTEDGMLFSFTVSKYSDDSVYLSSVEVIPTWVDMHWRNEEKKREYNILPLENGKQEQWQALFQLDEETAAKAAASYERTMAIVGEGLTAANAWLQSLLPQ